MKDKDSETLLVMITNPFAALNVIHSGLLAQLARHYRIEILTDLFGPDELRIINAHFQTDIELSGMIIPGEGRILKLIRRIEKVLFFHHFNIETERIRRLNDYSIGSKFYRCLAGLLQWIGIDTALLRFLREAIISISGCSDQSPIMKRFAAIISTSPLDIRENMVVNRAKRRTPSLAMVISWDNLSSKGLMNADHDLVFVWNKIMVNEYLHFYSPFRILNSIVHPVGVARFDHHFDKSGCTQSACFFRKSFDLNYQDKVILFATSPTKHFPSQTEIIKHLLEYADLRRDVKIMIRVHAFDSLKNYREFTTFPNIRFSVPEILQSSDYPGIPSLDSLSNLTFILKNTDVCVHTASTIQLDALACGTPVIDISYDGDSVVPYARSVRRFYDYSHQKNMPSELKRKIVISKEDLHHLLNEALGEGAMDSGCDPDALKTLTHFDQPESVDTITKIILKWLG